MKECEFTQGIVCACAVLAKIEGEPTMARDVLAQCGLDDKKKLLAAGANEDDIEAIYGKR